MANAAGASCQHVRGHRFDVTHVLRLNSDEAGSVSKVTSTTKVFTQWSSSNSHSNQARATSASSDNSCRRDAAVLMARLGAGQRDAQALQVPWPSSSPSPWGARDFRRVHPSPSQICQFALLPSPPAFAWADRSYSRLSGNPGRQGPGHRCPHRQPRLPGPSSLGRWERRSSLE